MPSCAPIGNRRSDVGQNSILQAGFQPAINFAEPAKIE
jgi:hypothetical protein